MSVATSFEKKKKQTDVLLSNYIGLAIYYLTIFAAHSNIIFNYVHLAYDSQVPSK